MNMSNQIKNIILTHDIWENTFIKGEETVICEESLTRAFDLAIAKLELLPLDLSNPHSNYKRCDHVVLVDGQWYPVSSSEANPNGWLSWSVKLPDGTGNETGVSRPFEWARVDSDKLIDIPLDFKCAKAFFSKRQLTFKKGDTLIVKDSTGSNELKRGDKVKVEYVDGCCVCVKKYGQDFGETLNQSRFALYNEF